MRSIFQGRTYRPHGLQQGHLYARMNSFPDYRPLESTLIAYFGDSGFDTLFSAFLLWPSANGQTPRLFYPSSHQ